MFGHRHGHEQGRHHGFGPRGGGADRWERFGEGWDDRQRGGGGGGGRRRMFDGGELRLVLLRMIADEPRHGYELIRAVEELTGGAYAPSPGMVYPALTMLAEMELIAEHPSDTTRKRFGATEAGRAHLTENAELVTAMMARLTAAGEHRARSDRAPIRRSMRNLRDVVMQRLESGELSDDAVHEVSAMIDAVVQKIERLK